MKTLTLNEAGLNSSIFAPKRRPTSRMDFGDVATVGLCLRRTGGVWDTAKPDDRVFGIFMGEIMGEYYVGTMSVMESEPQALEKFGTLNALKDRWELD